VATDPWALPQLLHTDLNYDGLNGDIRAHVRHSLSPAGLLWAGVDWELHTVPGPQHAERVLDELAKTGGKRDVPSGSLIVQIPANNGFAFRYVSGLFCLGFRV